MSEQELKQQLIIWLDGNIKSTRHQQAVLTAKEIINDTDNTWPVLLQYKESQWEAWFPLGVGARIFNYLHPQQDEMDVDVPPFIEDLSICILKDGSIHIKPDGSVNVDSTNEFFVSKDLPLPALLEIIKQKLRLTTTPSLYSFTDGARFSIKDDTSLSNAISKNHRLFTSSKRLTPQSSIILDKKDRFPYVYDPTTRIIKFPLEAGIFPSELVDYSDLVGQFNLWLQQMKTLHFESCCMINGLVKSGKSVACNHIFPATAANHFPNALFGYIDLDIEGIRVNGEYIESITTLRNALWKYLQNTLGITMDKCKIESAPNVEHDIRTYIRTACKFSTLNFLIIDELQRLFQSKNGDSVYSLFKSMVNTTAAIHSNLRIIFTGSTLVRAWNEVLKCTASDTPPHMNIHIVSISCHCDSVYLETARKIHRKQTNGAPEEIISQGHNPATLSFFVDTWFKKLSKEGEELSGVDRIAYAIETVQEKFKSEFLVDVHPLLKELTEDRRKILFELTEGTSGDPALSLGLYAVIFNPFTFKYTTSGTTNWILYPSYLKFFISCYLGKDGSLKESDISAYLLTYHYKLEYLLALGRIGEHVKMSHSKPTELSKNVEGIVKLHFSFHSHIIDKNTYSTDRTFQYLLNHPKNSAMLKRFASVDHAIFDSYYCTLLVLIRNVYSHQSKALDSLKYDIDKSYIPSPEELMGKLKKSLVIQSSFTTFGFYWK